jgi:hypothetical protein
MGDPDYVSDRAPDKPCWRYDDLDLSLTFKSVQSRGVCLVELSTKNPDARLLGVPLFGHGLDATRSALQRIGVSHEDTYVAKGIDFQWFDHGLLLYTFGGAIEQVEWTILSDSLRDEEIDWSGRDQIG